jgi:hypothetical protein
MTAETEGFRAYTEDPNNQDTFDPTSLGAKPEMGTYLANRLYRAYMAGFRDGRRAEADEIKDHLTKTLLPYR